MKRMIPFTYDWTIKRSLIGTTTMLDIGCGDGRFMAEINADKSYEVTGIELFEPYIKKAKKKKVYKKIIKEDITKITLQKNSYDAVHTSQVLEHLKKKEGIQLLDKMEKAASKVIVIGTPNGAFHQDAYDGNHLQEHLSAWHIDDFKKEGYIVHGHGLKFVYGDEGLGTLNIAALKFLLYIISFLFSPLTYYFPQFGVQLTAVKKKNEKV